MAQKLRKKGWLATPDIPFARDDANRFLPWIVAFMLCLTGLMLAASLSLGAVMLRVSGDYRDSFTIQIPAASLDGKTDTATIVALLRDNDWAAQVHEISRSEMQSLIEPWMGQGAAVEKLPLPALIEVRIREGATVDLPALERRIAKLAPGAEIDDYANWIGKFSRFSATVRYTVSALAGLLVLTTLAIVVLTSKTALRLHQQTVEVLYTIGAQDDYIAAQFQRNAMWLVFRGALLGSLAAALIFWASQGLTSTLDAPLLPAFDFTRHHIVLFASLPVLTALAALVATRFAVLALLQQKL